MGEPPRSPICFNRMDVERREVYLTLAFFRLAKMFEISAWVDDTASSFLFFCGVSFFHQSIGDNHTPTRVWLCIQKSTHLIDHTVIEKEVTGIWIILILCNLCQQRSVIDIFSVHRCRLFVSTHPLQIQPPSTSGHDRRYLTLTWPGAVPPA